MFITDWLPLKYTPMPVLTSFCVAIYQQNQQSAACALSYYVLDNTDRSYDSVMGYAPITVLHNVWLARVVCVPYLVTVHSHASNRIEEKARDN